MMEGHGGLACSVDMNREERADQIYISQTSVCMLPDVPQRLTSAFPEIEVRKRKWSTKHSFLGRSHSGRDVAQQECQFS